MDILPSVWGAHSVALIDPIVVRGKLITAIMNAPDEWSPRLGSIGFRWNNQSWLRLGSMTADEFLFVSPEINLVGLRPESVIDLEDAESHGGGVPFEVKDNLLNLWQRQVASVLVALSMEHEKNFTRSQAWTFVTAALEGAVTPETETLFGLTFAKMNRGGVMVGGNLDFAKSMGWLSAAPNKGRGRVVLSKGEAVDWADSDGVIHAGRVASKVHQDDPGCWIYSSSPRWAEGYVVAAPVWVRRDQLQFKGWAPDWLEADLASSDKPSSVGFDQAEAASLEGVIQRLCPSSIRALSRLIGSGRFFPSMDWRDALEYMQSDIESTYARTPEDGDFVAVEQELNTLEIDLERISGHYFGGEPIKFVLISTGKSLSLTLAVRTGVVADICRGYWEEVITGVDDFDLLSSAKSLEGVRSDRQRELVASSRSIAELFGSSENVFTENAFVRAIGMTWQRIADHYEGAITEESLFRLQSVMMPSTDLMKSLFRRGKQSDLYKSIQADLVIGTGEKASFCISKHESRILPVSEVVKALNAFPDSHTWTQGASSIGDTIYELSALLDKRIDGFEDQWPKTSVYQEGMPVRLRGMASANDALDAYKEVLQGFLSVDQHGQAGKIGSILAVMDNLHLMDRFKAAIGKTYTLSKPDLESYARSELVRQMKKKFVTFDEGFQTRIINRVVDSMLVPGSQGVIMLVSSSGHSHKVRTESVKLTESAVSQSRAAELGGALEIYKSRYRLRGSGVFFDSIALIDPELCSLVNGESAMGMVKTSQPGVDDAGKYSDTGVVAGYALKDIRGYSRSDLMRHATNMSDQQKAKYLTKDLVWPRKSFEEMKEEGIPIKIAFVYDTLWRSIPRVPKSMAAEHLNVFISIVSGLKAEMNGLLVGYSNCADSLGKVNVDKFAEFALDIQRRVQNVTTSIDELTTVYPYRERKIRSYQVHWDTFLFTGSVKFLRDAGEATWAAVIKDKQRPKASQSGSRVKRDEIVREGPDYRNGRSVNGEDFIKTFSYSGVEYGNWTDQAEREKHLNFAFDSMMDFSRIMGWEPMALSLGGRLGLCIGSRGRGGANAANAHFEPANTAINLTRMRGDGALAHEYFHAVAYHFGKIATGSNSDVNNITGYELQIAGRVPPLRANGLRDEVRQAFYDLLVAIMRKPVEGSNPKDISAYTELSSMLNCALAEDGKAKDYWASPSEMFARAMEMWFKARLDELGERNDYLVRASKLTGAGSLYPDEEHLDRINMFVSPWLDALELSVRMVDHPFLGNIELPILNTELCSRMPISAGDLASLAKEELERIFKAYAPQLVVNSTSAQKAGMYDFARDVLTLNAGLADKETFYHEAWHACQAKLLSCDEREGLAGLFTTKSPMADLVAQAMRADGISERVIAHACSTTEELQAYAFQLWAVGKLKFGGEHVDAFYKAKGFVDSVVGVGDLFSPADAERLFSRFVQGELAARKGELLMSCAVDAAPDEWDSENVLFWDVASVAGDRDYPAQTIRMG